MPIKFIESSSKSYASRTRINAQADITIAMAVDFSTAGEVCTKKMVAISGKKYLAINLGCLLVTTSRVNKIVSEFNSVRKEFISVNIAGNGIYTLKEYEITQLSVDDFVFSLLEAVSNEYKGFISIKTGGQTGIDEAGAKAGLKLGMDVVVLAPNGWKFRNKEGNDICNEKLFKERFL